MGKAIAASPLTPPDMTSIYVVQPGNTLDSIAAAFNTTPTVLEMLNRLPNPDLIYSGEHLVVPTIEQNLPIGSQAMVCTLTAYTDGYQSTGKVPGDPGYGITATGQVARQGLSIAVDPSVIPYGTAVFIPGVGLRIADDTGGAIVGNRIDVFFNSQQTAMNFGVKPNVVVYLIPPADVAYQDGLPVFAASLTSPVNNSQPLNSLATQGTEASAANNFGSLASNNNNSVAPASSSLAQDTVTAMSTSANLAPQNLEVSSSARMTAVVTAAPSVGNPTSMPLATRELLANSSQYSSMTTNQELGKAISSLSLGTQGNQSDILDVWVITLDRYIWQPMLESAKHSL